MSEFDYKNLRRGEMLVEIRRFREALVEFYKFLAVQPENYTALCNISRCHLELNDLRTALEFANAAIAVAPEGEWAYRLKSILFRATGEHQSSLKAAEEAVSKAPHFILSLQTLAYAQINNFRLEDAEKTVKLMLEAAPDNSATHDAGGFLALKREDYATAEKYFLQALKIDAESANSLNNLGFVYFETSRRIFGIFKKSDYGRRAKECFLSALKINPNFALAHQNLQAAENNRFYFGSQKNRIAFKTFIFFASTTIVARIATGFIPALINFFTPYEPRLFYIGINLVFGFFIVLSVLNIFFLRRSNVSLDNLNRFFGKTKKLGVVYCVSLFVPQFVGGFFFAFLETRMSSFALIILLFTGAALFGAAIKIFQYFDYQILE